MDTNKKLISQFMTLVAILMVTIPLSAQDPNFHIYLCFGQSNMEGQGTVESLDMIVDNRFKVFQSLDCPGLNRKKAEWYPSTPPTCQCYSKLSPADYFGKTMVANLPDSISVGVINVAIGGCDIRLFDKDIYQEYDSTYEQSWFTDKVKAYGWNPYKHLIDLARLAQRDGVIKGILLHQGETNTGNSMWPSYVKKIYEDMLKDLSLKADQVPLLAGEVYSEAGNCCSAMNEIINTLDETIPTAHVISSKGCTGMDNAHFDSEGYRKLGRRYAQKMLSLMGSHSFYLEAECGKYGKNWTVASDVNASNSTYATGSVSGGSTVPPTDKESMLRLNFEIKDDGKFFIYGRFNNSESVSDAFWIKIDNGPFELTDSLSSKNWEWIELKIVNLSKGMHSVTIAFSEKGAKVDKLFITNTGKPAKGMGEEATNLCEVNYKK